MPRFLREYRGEVPGCPGGVGAYVGWRGRDQRQRRIPARVGVVMRSFSPRSRSKQFVFLVCVIMLIFGTGRMVCGRFYVTVRCPFVCPSVFPLAAASRCGGFAAAAAPGGRRDRSTSPPRRAHVAAGLLLWARREGDVDRSSAAAACSVQQQCSATLSADVGSCTDMLFKTQ